MVLKVREPRFNTVKGCHEVDPMCAGQFLITFFRVKPARALIVGAGVGGLQAIATAKRLGTVVGVADIRPAAAEQAQFLGVPGGALGSVALGVLAMFSVAGGFDVTL